MEITPREIYTQSIAHYHFITRLKLAFSIAFFIALHFLEPTTLNMLNSILSGLNCVLILILMELTPRMLRDSLHNKDDKYTIPKAILDSASLIFTIWIFLSTAIGFLL